MSPTYCYSLDRETWAGAFSSREAARDAAINRALVMDAVPGEVFVGIRVGGDPQAAMHASEVLARMARRATDRVGADAQDYLKHVTEQQEAELDTAIEHAVAVWLAKHNLGPSYFKVKAISEYPVPQMQSAARLSPRDEVHEIGQTDGE